MIVDVEFFLILVVMILPICISLFVFIFTASDGRRMLVILLVLLVAWFVTGGGIGNDSIEKGFLFLIEV